MDNDNALMLTGAQIEILDVKYQTLAKNALYDKSSKNDLEAALYAPATFLKNPANFEAAFDVIIYHLNEAYKKSGDDDSKRIVSRVADELFNNHVYIIQYKIDYILSQNKNNLLQTISKFISEVPQQLVKNLIEVVTDEGVSDIADTVGPEIANLSSAYMEYLSTKWMVKEQEEYFYNQLANVYQKILDSECFNSEIGLVRNNYIRNKENILRYVVIQKGLVAATNLTRYDKTDSQTQDSSRVILRTLCEKNDWENVSTFLLMVKSKGITNYFELKKEAVAAYKIYLDNIMGTNENIVNTGLKFVGKILISIAIFILTFYGTIYYKFSADNSVAQGFWNSVWHVFSMSLSSLLLAIIISLGSLIVTYFLLSILNGLIRNIKRIIASRRIKTEMIKFEAQT